MVYAGGQAQSAPVPGPASRVGHAGVPGAAHRREAGVEHGRALPRVPSAAQVRTEELQISYKSSKVQIHDS